MDRSGLGLGVDASDRLDVRPLESGRSGPTGVVHEVQDKLLHLLREMSPLANAAYTCCSIGVSTAAAPTQARVIHRRSRRDSPERFHSSPKTESTTPCDRYGVIGGGASDTMTSR